MKYRIESACLSEIGKVRDNNEDNYYFEGKNLEEKNNGSKYIHTSEFYNKDNKAFAIFDGMGGETKGERASYIASTVLKEYVKENYNKEIDWNEYIQIANETICDEMYGKERMGTTVAGVQFCNDYVNFCNIGDSRIYILYKNNIEQISEDHNEAKLQERLKISTKAKAKLTQYLGIKKEEMLIKPYTRQFVYEQIKKIMICTDGVTDMLSDNEIQEILIKDKEAKVNVDNLVKEAMKKGGVDNTTVIVFNISEDKSEKSNNIINKIKNILINT